MAIVLITGMSGTGKSTVLAELARRGFRVVDTDDADWTLDDTDHNGAPDRRWHPERMAALVRSHVDGTFLCRAACRTRATSTATSMPWSCSRVPKR